MGSTVASQQEGLGLKSWLWPFSEELTCSPSSSLGLLWTHWFPLPVQRRGYKLGEFKWTDGVSEDQCCRPSTDPSRGATDGSLWRLRGKRLGVLRGGRYQAQMLRWLLSSGSTWHTVKDSKACSNEPADLSFSFTQTGTHRTEPLRAISIGDIFIK